MSINYLNPKLKKLKTAHLYFISIILGVIGGSYGIPAFLIAGEIITDIFIKIFKLISLPIIALSIIVTFSNFRKDAHLRKIGQKTLFYTISTTLIAALLACVLYMIIAPLNINAVGDNIGHFQPDLSNKNYWHYFSNIIPSNILTPFIEHQVMGVLLISMLIGIAISFIPEKITRHTMNNFFKGAHSIFIVITSWIVKVMPIAFFGFIVTTIAQLKAGLDIKGFSQYLLVIVLANIIQWFVILPAFLYTHKIKPFTTMKKMLPALSVAFFSKSSAGALPITMETIETCLGVSPRVSRFVLPLCTSINMNGCAAFIFTTVIYLMQNHGLQIDGLTMIIWIFVATIAAIENF